MPDISAGPIPTGFYGWKPSPPDINDQLRRFVPLPRIVAALPPSFDLDTPSLGVPFDPCWNQGRIGSCGPNSLGENIVFDQLKLGLPPKMPSRLFIYYITRLLMGTINSDSGVENRTMLQALNQYGWCDEEQWPYDVNKYQQRPPENCFAAAKARAGKISFQSVAQDLNVMKACIYQTQRPFIFGFSVYEKFESQQTVQTGDIQMPTLGEQQLGGHDVLFVGWDDSRQRFKLKNHYSPQWGNGGYGTIPYSYALTSQLSNDFWTVVNLGAVPAPTPTPTPTPVPPVPAPLPTPAPLDPTQRKKIIDEAFLALESKYSQQYFVASTIKMVHTLMDNSLTGK